jgi:hypothetical protein
VRLVFAAPGVIVAAFTSDMLIAELAGETVRVPQRVVEVAIVPGVIMHDPLVVPSSVIVLIAGFAVAAIAALAPVELPKTV